MKTSIFPRKAALSLGICLGLFSSIQQTQASLLSIAQSPLILSESVAPNLILTLDDSGSMRYAFAPDSMADNGNTRRFKAAVFNPMYYNPAVTYLIPTKINSDGSRANPGYSTSFSAAYSNGLKTSTGTIDLSTSYWVTRNSDPATTPGTLFTSTDSSYGWRQYVQNPAADFGPAVLSQSSSTGTPQVVNNYTYSNNLRSCPSNNAVDPVSSTSSNSTTGADGNITKVDTTTTTTYAYVSCKKNSGNNRYTLIVNTTTTETITTTVSRPDRTQAKVPAYYYVYDNTLTGCTSSTADDNCYRLVTVSASSGVGGTDERQNFAIWYSFYRTRALATLSAANLSFNSLPATIRLTWQTLNSCTTLNSSGCGTNYFRKFSDQHRGNFFTWLTGVGFNQGTSLRAAMGRAGEFLTGSDAWAYEPNPFTSGGGKGTTVQTPTYACRPSYQIMMTDGMWNGDDGSPSQTFKPDHSNTTLPDRKTYSKQAPFNDATQNTLADLAFHYWATDANTNLKNDVKPLLVAPNTSDATAEYWDPRNDPATWQHLVNYTIGLGLTSALDKPGIPWSGDTYGGAGYTALKNGTSWPAASDGSANNVYDLWHTAINSRGEFFSADSPDKIVEAFRTIINRISNRTASASAPGVTASIVEDTITREVYETQFNSENWSGNLIKYSIDSNGARTQSWDLSTTLNGNASRTIKMFSASNASKLQDFTWSNLTAAQQALLNRDFDTTNSTADTKGADRLAYVRGDQSNEGSASGQFRERSSIMGDIVNSSPVLVGTPKYLAYLADAIDGGSNTDGSSKYAAFREANNADGANPSRRPMVYVGANDGMLHGFDTRTGAEVFAYVPTAVIENLYKLPAKKYKGGAHQFYVDGTPTVSDVYYSGAWHTVLVGTLRAGGRSMFALDITNPNAVTLLWEKSFDSGDAYVNMGYSFPQPTIARLHTGKWAVVTGNGYGNQAGTGADKASLMILDIQTGEMVKELVVTGDATKANGLSTVKLADNNSDGVADYAYAGDLQGNLWRFDLFPSSVHGTTSGDPFRRGTGGITDSASNADDFVVSYGGRPLYTAQDSRSSGATAQTIMAPPSLVRHPTTLGYLVIFGTGKYFETTDGNVDSTRAQSIYGIWDRKTKGQSTSAPSSALDRSNLVTQTITEEAATNPFGNNPNVQGIRTISQNTIQWYATGATDNSDSSVNKWGWVLDLKIAGSSTLSGEMMINPMATRGTTLLVNTLTPNADPCKEGVDSWVYGLDPTTGGRTRYSVFDMNNDKTIDGNDTYGSSNTVVSGYKKPGAGGFTTNNGEIFTSPGLGSGMMYSSGPTSTGRQSWRVIPEEAR